MLLRNVSILFSACLVFLTFSKMAFASLVLLTVVYLFKDSDISCRLCKIGRSAGLLVLSAVVLAGQTDNKTILKRLILLRQWFEVIKKYPIFGTGLDTYVKAAPTLPALSFDTLNQPVHSIYLLILAELGIVGTVGFSILAYPFLKRVIRISPYIIAGIVLTGLADHYWITLAQNRMLIAVLL